MQIPKELRTMVYSSVKLLGHAIKEIYGEKIFLDIEKLRHEMKAIRNKDSAIVYKTLKKTYYKNLLESNASLQKKAKAYSLMLELINSCEAAYRSHRLEHLKVTQQKKPSGMAFVFTSHPTEARSPEFLYMMEKIEALLLKAYSEGIENFEAEIFFLLKMALKINLARNTKPGIEDEAYQIFHTTLSCQVLSEQILQKKRGINVFFETWSGGDKDGHPFVGPHSMLDSFTLSRTKLIAFVEKELMGLSEEVTLLKNNGLRDKIITIRKFLKMAATIKTADGELITKIKKMFFSIKIDSPSLNKIKTLLDLYPAMVMPLEIREDHELIAKALAWPKQNIALMLKTLKRIAKGSDPKCYVKSFIISMCTESIDMLNAAQLIINVFKELVIPVVPLFENEKGLVSSLAILKESMDKFPFEHIYRSKWEGKFEVMVGYSDSTKENGVLPGRLMVERAIHNLEKFLINKKLIPIFFHGSGGSTNRGGGSVKEQLSWLPKSSLDFYKATIQGEMVQRQFQNPKIMRSHLNKIIEEFNSYKTRPVHHCEALTKFASSVQLEYKGLLEDQSFFKLVTKATPYEFLNILKIGSRPAKRSGKGKFSVRAIPWTLCWTQTRIFLPVWWGIGSSWAKLTQKEKKEIVKDLKQSPLLQTFIKHLGFTLAKVEYGVWKFHLFHSGLNRKEKKYWNKKIEKELKGVCSFFNDVTGNKKFLWFRPWLAESIYFRSSMIHPLNVIQKIAMHRNNRILLRETVTGISSGMLTTG